MTQTINNDNWNAAVSGNFSDAKDWSLGVEPDDALPTSGIYDAYVGFGIKSTAAFTVTSSTAATVDFLDISDANATFAITGKTFTVDSIQISNGGSSTVYDQGTISIGAGATMAFGSTASSASPINYNYSGEIFDTGGKVDIASGGTLLLDEPLFEFISNGKTGVVTLTGSAVIKGATTIDGTLANINNIIQGGGTIGNGEHDALDGRSQFLNDAAGVIDANAATAMTINTGGLRRTKTPA